MALAARLHLELDEFRKATYDGPNLSMARVHTYKASPTFELNKVNRLFTMLVRSQIADADVALVQTLIGLGVDVNQGDISHAGHGHTPLMSAAKEGNIMCLKLLIKYNANVAATDPAGHTALHHAAFGGHLSCLLTLIKAGAQVDAEDKLGRSPLWFAFRRLQKIQSEEHKKANAQELERELHEAFKQIDEDDDKSLSVAELRVYAGHFEEIEWSELRDVLSIGGPHGKKTFSFWTLSMQSICFGGLKPGFAFTPPSASTM